MNRTYKMLASLVFFIFVVLFIWYLQPMQIGGVTVSLIPQTYSKKQLKMLGVPVNAINVSSINVVGPDGNMPEIASRSFDLEGMSDSLELERFYNHSCRENGFGKVTDQQKNLDPSAFCFKEKGQSTLFLFNSQCAENSCRSVVTIRSI